MQSSFDGVSMRYSFDDGDAAGRRETQFYSMLGSRAIWHEGWKAVTHPPDDQRAGATSTTTPGSSTTSTTTEPSCTTSPASSPTSVRELINLWFAEAGANGAFPLDDRSAVEILNTPRPQLTSPRDRYLYYPDGAGVPEALSVNIRNRNYIIGARVDIPGARRERCAVRAGLARSAGTRCTSRTTGLHYVYNFVGMLEQQIDRRARTSRPART